MHKAALREQFLQKRLAMPESEWTDRSDALVDQLLAWLKGKTFDHYILYRSFRREPSLERLASILPTDDTFYPRIQGKAMNFYSTAGGFETNRFGLEEPHAHPARELQVFSAKTLLIIPAVAYDLQCFRLGYGGGFFDRFLDHKVLTTLGVSFDNFVVKELPREVHDQPVQTVITDKRVLTRSS
ncbi:MAG TPA: 5-formyltetrahydrofolate cyclo-ligase [Oligoflexus sp.]|uniref:5-formyltetrahydrofolate cyclo-ligase n=1 Tax=Oligoflexus sp. TaxID=1971216 RepID=UPI002D80471B|nr:5-formyltetrahydrofolate cyclo-ligase [Oligoflexus sp.]HET9239663.1 5-formyltetrahydrofolate cyclo-ligase [Oligoflexus sp.]